MYSTCSIHAIEDEHVVRAALQSTEALSANFKLASPSEVLPQWKRRGYPEEMEDPSASTLASRLSISFTQILAHAASVVRCLPGEDATNGFFVAGLKRVEQESRLSSSIDEQRLNERRKRKTGDLSEEGPKKKKKKKPNSQSKSNVV